MCNLVFRLFILQLCLSYFFFTILGKTEFGPDEDAHVVGDCVKVHVSIADAI